jgi:peptidylprolyl isomerase domain and WD repeat-containing protein 1
MIGGVQVAQDLQRSDVPLYRLDAIDFKHHIVIEKEIEKIDGVPTPNVVFDESSNFLLYLALLSIKAKCLYLFFWQSM